VARKRHARQPQAGGLPQLDVQQRKRDRDAAPPFDHAVQEAVVHRRKISAGTGEAKLAKEEVVEQPQSGGRRCVRRDPGAQLRRPGAHLVQNPLRIAAGVRVQRHLRRRRQQWQRAALAATERGR
jgi:hypothetical protein